MPSNKLLERLGEFVDNQTIKPTKKELTIIINQFYKEKEDKQKKAEIKPKPKITAYNEFYKVQFAILKEKEILLKKEDRMSSIEKTNYINSLWKQELSKRIEDDIEN